MPIWLLFKAGILIVLKCMELLKMIGKCMKMKLDAHKLTIEDGTKKKYKLKVNLSQNEKKKKKKTLPATNLFKLETPQKILSIF